MLTVAKLIEALQQFPPDALAYAYEGEDTGVVVVAAVPGGEELGFIPASEERPIATDPAPAARA